MLDIQIQEALEKNMKVKLIAYSVSPTIEERTKRVLRHFLERCGCVELHGAVYTVVKELLINAVKANYKNIYFEDYNPKNRAAELIGYNTALQLFKLELNRDESDYFVRAARRKGICAEMVIGLERDTLVVSVTNPVPMTDIEMENVVRKLFDAGNCECMADYFLINEDDPNTEGAGLGLVLVTMILKSLGVDLSTFGVVSRDGKTEASFRVMLNEDTMRQYEAATKAN